MLILFAVKIYPVDNIFHHSTPKEEAFYFLQCLFLTTMPSFRSAPMTIFKDLFFSIFVQDDKPFICFAFTNIVELVF